MHFLEELVVGVVGIFVLILLFEIAKLANHIRHAKLLGRKTIAFSRVDTSTPKRILVIGDSTAYGTGATDSQHSFAGRVARDIPGATIDNEAENAMSLARLVTKLQSLPIEVEYTLAIIHIGGVDSLAFTPLFVVRRRLTRALEEAKKRADRVILVSVNNTGSAPAYTFPLTMLYGWRSHLISNISDKVCKVEGVTHVPLWTPRRADPLRADITGLYASDGLHPNDAGYALWYEKLRPALTV